MRTASGRVNKNTAALRKINIGNYSGGLDCGMAGATRRELRAIERQTPPVLRRLIQAWRSPFTRPTYHRIAEEDARRLYNQPGAPDRHEG
jgi:hypothetical protein